MLQVQALSVEVGGRQIINGASFTVMPRDKVGLVGRNGAGKTTLFRVLGGALESTGGKILRKGGFGYLPQDPRIAGVLDGRTAITHVLSGRGIDEELIRLEKLRITMEEDASERNVARYSRAHDEFATLGRLRRRERGPLDGRRSRACRATGWNCRSACSAVASADVSSSPASCSPAPTCLLLDEPTNHLDIDAKMWLLQFLRTYRGALLVISHDIDLLDEAITRVLHLDRPAEDAVGELVEYKGTYSQYRTVASARRRAAGQEGGAAGQGDRPNADGRRSLRCQGHQGGDGAQQGEAHRPARGATRARSTRAIARCG